MKSIAKCSRKTGSGKSIRCWQTDITVTSSTRSERKSPRMACMYILSFFFSSSPKLFCRGITDLAQNIGSTSQFIDNENEIDFSLVLPPGFLGVEEADHHQQ